MKTIAICYTHDKKVKFVCEVRNVNEHEYEKLCQDMLDYETKQEMIIDNLNKDILFLGGKLKNLEDEIKLLKGID